MNDEEAAEEHVIRVNALLADILYEAGLPAAYAVTISGALARRGYLCVSSADIISMVEAAEWS